jgi:hypothetical protein
MGILGKISIGDGILRPIYRDLLPLRQIDFLDRFLLPTAA